MKKYLILLISILTTVVFFAACVQQQQQVKTEDTAKTEDKVKEDLKVKSEDKKDTSDSAGDFAVKTINNQVKDFSIDGFPGGSAKLSTNEDLENMKKIVGLVKPLIEKIPDGYVMQITGHAANYENKSRQMYVSKQRAIKIYNELKKAGVPAKKMKYKGVGITEPLEGVDSKDAKQRRVSFKAVKK